VVMMFPNFNKLGDKIGVNSETIQNGKFVNFLNPWSEVDAESKTVLQNEINEIYAEFKGVVSEGRKINLNELEKYAQGRIWTSKDAKEFRLVDEIGSLQNAVDKAAELAKLTPGTYSIKEFPRKKNMLTELMKEKFNIDMISSMVNSDLEELKLDNVKETYHQIKNDPVQARLPFEMVE